jgi:hypothetical protein
MSPPFGTPFSFGEEGTMEESAEELESTEEAEEGGESSKTLTFSDFFDFLLDFLDLDEDEVEFSAGAVTM